jgi:uncharacterized protein
MRQSRIEYGRLVEGALRGVVRDVLARVGREGLPSPHHFYVTFRTQAPDVVMPDFLRERYPVDMTIVLQHQFWDLEVDEEGFSVTLSFHDQLHRLHVPFAAVKVFADPGVEFGLQFTLEADQSAEVTPLRAVPSGPQATPADPPPPAAAGVVSPLLPGPRPAPPGAGGGEAAPAPTAAEGGGAEIVPLDRFRRK